MEPVGHHIPPPPPPEPVAVMGWGESAQKRIVHLVSVPQYAVATVARFALTIIFTTLSTITFFQFEGIEATRVANWKATKEDFVLVGENFKGVFQPVEKPKVKKPEPAALPKPITVPALKKVAEEGLKKFHAFCQPLLGKGILEVDEKELGSKAMAMGALGAFWLLNGIDSPTLGLLSTLTLVGTNNLGTQGTAAVVAGTALWNMSTIYSLGSTGLGLTTSLLNWGWSLGGLGTNLGTHAVGNGLELTSFFWNKVGNVPLFGVMTKLSMIIGGCFGLKYLLSGPVASVWSGIKMWTKLSLGEKLLAGTFIACQGVVKAATLGKNVLWDAPCWAISVLEGPDNGPRPRNTKNVVWLEHTNTHIRCTPTPTGQIRYEQWDMAPGKATYKWTELKTDDAVRLFANNKPAGSGPQVLATASIEASSYKYKEHDKNKIPFGLKDHVFKKWDTLGLSALKNRVAETTRNAVRTAKDFGEKAAAVAVIGGIGLTALYGVNFYFFPKS